MHASVLMLYLLICKCVVLTTRPLVMCALHTHIEMSETQKSRTMSLSSAVASLLQCCVDSAQTVLQTLRTLADEDLIGNHPPPRKKAKCHINITVGANIDSQ